MRSEKFINILTVVVASCTILVAGVTVGTKTTERSTPRPRRPVAVRDWQAVAQNGTPIGLRDAPVVITAFSDFQCPFCRALAEVLDSLLVKYPSELVVSFRHFPVDATHKFARTAANSAQCAASQGRFREYHDLLFENQDKLDRMDPLDFARRAGVADLHAFESCRAGPEVAARLHADSVAGIAVGLRGTPTVMINQWRLYQRPTFSTLDSAIQAELKGGSRRR